jgi:hypothetical protein
MKEAALDCPVTDLKGTHGGYRQKPGKSRIDHIFYSGGIKGLMRQMGSAMKGMGGGGFPPGGLPGR